MKRNIIAVVLVVGVSALGFADDKPAGKAGGQSPQAQMQQKLLAQFDANKDGVLTGQEQLAANEFLRRMGIVGGGVEPGGFPNAEQFAKQFDKDGDGKLSDQEKAMAQAAWQRMRNHKNGPAYGPAYGPGVGFGQANANAGGVAVANAAAGGDAKGAKVSALVKRFDADGDGKLNDEEKAAAQAELKKNKKEAKAKVEKSAGERK